MRSLFAVIIVTSALLNAQPSAIIAAPPGEVIGVGNFLHLVSNLDKSLEFYHDILGMDLQPGANGQIPIGPRPWLATPEIAHLYDAVGGQYRVGNAMVPENPMRAELIEWKDVDRKPVAPRIVDPGASMMVLTVRDISPVLARVKKAAANIVTTGGSPVDLADGSRAILLKDPDGFFVEVIQRNPAPATKAPATSDFIDVGFAFTVSDTESMMRVFRDALGFDMRTAGFRNEGEMLTLFGLHRVQFRVTSALVPGTTFPVEFYEFKGIDRKAVHSRPRDPGSALLRLRVRDTDSIIKALEGTGAKVASAEGKPVTLAGANGSQRAAITSVTDNLFIQTLQAIAAK